MADEHPPIPKPMPLRFCPLCADIVIQNTGSCFKRCRWPPEEAAIGGAAADGAAGWIEKCPTDALEMTSSSYRKVLDAIDQEIRTRLATASSERAGGLLMLIRDLVPVRSPRMAAPAAEVERLTVDSCQLPSREARDFLATSGFVRARRVVRGRDVYLYKYRFLPSAEPSFVGLQNGER